MDRRHHKSSVNRELNQALDQSSAATTTTPNALWNEKQTEKKERKQKQRV
jgi:hypothetical protein